MVSRILANFSAESRREFDIDFVKLIKMTVQLDKEYGNAEEEMLYNLPVYKTYVAMFNKKYPNLLTQFVESDIGLRLRIFIKNETDVKKVFKDAASKIEGISAIGSEVLEKDSVFNRQQFEVEFNQVKDKIYIQYIGSGSLFLKLDKKLKAVELMSDMETLADDDFPGYKLCMFYALKTDFDRNINLKNVAGKFSSHAFGSTKAGLGPSR